MLLRRAHRLSDHRKVILLDEPAKYEVHFALLQFAPDVRWIPEVLTMQVAVQALHLSKVDPNVRGHLAKSGLRLMHFDHLERNRVVVYAHGVDATFEHDTSFESKIRGIPSRAVFPTLHRQQGSLVATTTSVVVVVVVIVGRVVLLVNVVTW